MAQYAGIGTLLKMGDGASPEVFTTVAQVKDISLGALSAGTYDTTTHDVANFYKTFITGLREGGEVTFKLLFDAGNTTHKDVATGLLGVFNAAAVKNWQLIPGNYASPVPKWTFSGPITKIGAFTYPVDGLQECDCTIKISGKPALA